MNRRPDTDEYAPYYDKYITLVPEGDIAATLSAQFAETVAILRAVPEEQGLHAYAPGKWSLKEMLGHVIDTERIMAYRALCVARGEQTPLPGFEQDDYVAKANFNARTLAALIDEWECVRRSNITLFKPWSDEEWQRRGTASGNPISARALAYIVAGHELYHRNLLQTRYLA